MHNAQRYVHLHEGVLNKTSTYDNLRSVESNVKGTVPPECPY